MGELRCGLTWNILDEKTVKHRCRIRKCFFLKGDDENGDRKDSPALEIAKLAPIKDMVEERVWLEDGVERKTLEIELLSTADKATTLLGGSKEDIKEKDKAKLLLAWESA